MPKIQSIVITLFFCVLSFQAKSDSWLDPTWNRMLDSSDVVALVKYISSGGKNAKARIEYVYKGQIKPGEEIYISGFSNRFGPYDKMQRGDQYLVFLNSYTPSESEIERWDDIVKEDHSLASFVGAIRQNKAYFVWSPSSGDLKVAEKNVQYDLTQTTFYSNQNFFPLNQFEEFLEAKYNHAKTDSFCQKIIGELNPKDDNPLQSQLLMQLVLLGYNKFEKTFSDFTASGDIAARYALAQLMGNINTAQSRKVLETLMDDKTSFVQGETVRQLKKMSDDTTAMILLSHLKTSGKMNYGPKSIMDPVMNTVDGGRSEIILALGELKYKPAIPELISLLEAEDEDYFYQIVDALKILGTTDYIKSLNKLLDNKSYKLATKIAEVIAHDSISECIPSLKNFISTCNRNHTEDLDAIISPYWGLAKFRDSSTISFLLSDYKKFLSCMDTLDVSIQLAWTNRYIDTFEQLEVAEARPLILQSIFDWHGIDRNFAVFPKLFRIKKQAEDSVRYLFTKKLKSTDYKLNHCIAFIQNSSAVMTGEKPVIRYMIEVETKTPDNAELHLGFLTKELNLDKKSIYLRAGYGSYYPEQQKRFDSDFYSTPLNDYLGYARKVPDKSDILFLQQFIEYKIISESYHVDLIKRVINELKKHFGE